MMKYVAALLVTPDCRGARQLMDAEQTAWKWLVSAQEEQENSQPSTFVQPPCEMAGVSSDRSGYARNKTWLTAVQRGRHVKQVSALKQDKCRWKQG